MGRSQTVPEPGDPVPANTTRPDTTGGSWGTLDRAESPPPVGSATADRGTADRTAPDTHSARTPRDTIGARFSPSAPHSQRCCDVHWAGPARRCSSSSRIRSQKNRRWRVPSANRGASRRSGPTTPPTSHADPPPSATLRGRDIPIVTSTEARPAADPGPRGRSIAMAPSGRTAPTIARPSRRTSTAAASGFPSRTGRLVGGSASTSLRPVVVTA